MATQEELQAKYAMLKPYLRGPIRRLWAAAEAAAIGRGGIKILAAVTGMCCATISAGLRELRGLRKPLPERPRAKRGPKFSEDKDPTLLTDLERLITDEIAGNPMSEQRWIRSSTLKLRDKLREQGHDVGHCTVYRLLKKLGFSLRANQKRRGGSRCPGRDEQFRYIASQKEAFRQAAWPVISVDTKKKVLIGEFRNPGRAWCRVAAKVSEHDFTSAAEYRAVPFGIYDLSRNEGYVVVGISNDTPEFAVSAIASWWEQEGRKHYLGATELLILVDCGGTNGNRCKAWKVNLQEKLCDRFGLTITVCHYPPGCSKWNPIEHRLFSQISINWAGRPLTSLGIMLGYIRGTTTTTGLTVQAHLDEGTYNKGQKVTLRDMAKVNLKPHAVCSAWNYTISPAS
jgi:hypothetical protein